MRLCSFSNKRNIYRIITGNFDNDRDNVLLSFVMPEGAQALQTNLVLALMHYKRSTSNLLLILEWRMFFY